MVFVQISTIAARGQIIKGTPSLAVGAILNLKIIQIFMNFRLLFNSRVGRTLKKTEPLRWRHTAVERKGAVKRASVAVEATLVERNIPLPDRRVCSSCL